MPEEDVKAALEGIRDDVLYHATARKSAATHALNTSLAVDEIFGVSNAGFAYANFLRELAARDLGKPFEPLVRPEVRAAIESANQLPFGGSADPRGGRHAQHHAPARAPPRAPGAPGHSSGASPRSASPRASSRASPSPRPPSAEPTRSGTPAAGADSPPADGQRHGTGSPLREGAKRSRFALRGERPPPAARRSGHKGDGPALHTGRYAPWLMRAMHHANHADERLLAKLDAAWHTREPPPLSPSGHPQGDYMTPCLASKRWQPPEGVPTDPREANVLLERSFEEITTQQQQPSPPRRQPPRTPPPPTRSPRHTRRAPDLHARRGMATPSPRRTPSPSPPGVRKDMTVGVLRAADFSPDPWHPQPFTPVLSPAVLSWRRAPQSPRARALSARPAPAAVRRAAVAGFEVTPALSMSATNPYLET